MSQRQSRTMRMYRTTDWSFPSTISHNVQITTGESKLFNSSQKKKNIKRHYCVSDVRMEFSTKTGGYEFLSETATTILQLILSKRKETNLFLNLMNFYVNICQKRKTPSSLNDFILIFRKTDKTQTAIRALIPYVSMQ